MKVIYTKKDQQLADTITPIGCYLNLRDHFSGTALFESSDYASKSNSKSFICADPLVTFSMYGDLVEIREEGELVRKKKLSNASEDFLKYFNAFREKYSFDDSETATLNGFFGLIGYDAIPNFEAINFREKKRFESLPEVCFAVYRYVVIFDNFTNTITLLMNSFNRDFERFERFSNILFNAKIHAFSFTVSSAVKSNETDESFSEKVLRAKEQIKAGEVFQLVLSRAFSQIYSGEPFEVYRQLRVINPSPYMFYLELDEAKIFGASPEAQLKIQKGYAEIHPIAGTVKRTMNEEEDIILTEALINDEKENAEHTMLVDLARNDLNVTCENITVKNLKEIQTFSHVIHMVSKVQGELKHTNCMEVFARSFPAGTLSGAPKYRAMELIDEMETVNRGYYGGAVGQITPDGDLNMAIVIRSCLAYKNELHYQAGAGIVYDSVPKNEVNEVYNKIGAVQRAINLADKK